MKSTTWLTAASLRAILGMRVGSNKPSFGGVGGCGGPFLGRLLLAVNGRPRIKRSGGTPTCGQIAYLQQEEIACVNT